MQVEDVAATRTRSPRASTRKAVRYSDPCFAEFAAPNDSADV